MQKCSRRYPPRQVERRRDAPFFSNRPQSRFPCKSFGLYRLSVLYRNGGRKIGPLTVVSAVRGEPPINIGFWSNRTSPVFSANRLLPKMVTFVRIAPPVFLFLLVSLVGVGRLVALPVRPQVEARDPRAETAVRPPTSQNVAWRWTRRGWQDASRWNQTDLGARPIERVSPILLAINLILANLFVLIWCSDEWQVGRLLGHPGAADESPSPGNPVVANSSPSGSPFRKP